MALDFPPSDQSPFEAPNGVTYVWDGNKWVAADPANFLPIEGGTLTGDLTVPSLNGGPLAGYRNAIINGDFRVWQRSTDATADPAVSEYVSADRWIVSAGTRCSEVTNLAVPYGFDRAARLRIGAAATVFLKQGIELKSTGHQSIFYPGSTWTISYWTTEVNAANVSCSAAFADDAAVTNTGTKVDIVALTAMTATGEQSNNTNRGVYYRYSHTFTVGAGVVPAATNTCLSVTAALTNQTDVSITGVQLEPGPVATPFEHRPIGTELALCERYYQRSRVRGTCFNRNASSFVSINIPYRPMRVAPSVPDGTQVLCNQKSNSSGANESLDITSTADLETNGYIRCNGQTDTGLDKSDIWQIQTGALRLDAEI